jgi:hypothetical protein
MRVCTSYALLLLASVLTACGVSPHAVIEPRPTVDVRRTRPPAPSDELTCIADPRIDTWERRLRAPRGVGDTMRHDVMRGEEYLPSLRPLVVQAGLPTSLALLPAIESGFDAHARGRAGEYGLWQLRPATARRFGLVVTRKRDDRVAPDRATRAAARYLRQLYGHYQDWPLALAAYNAGEGRVDRALARHPRGSFWDLARAGLLPRHSRDYVPRFLALVRIHEGAAGCPPEALQASRGVE